MIFKRYSFISREAQDTEFPTEDWSFDVAEYMLKDIQIVDVRAAKEAVTDAISFLKYLQDSVSRFHNHVEVPYPYNMDVEEFVREYLKTPLLNTFITVVGKREDTKEWWSPPDDIYDVVVSLEAPSVRVKAQLDVYWLELRNRCCPQERTVTAAVRPKEVWIHFMHDAIIRKDGSPYEFTIKDNYGDLGDPLISLRYLLNAIEQLEEKEGE